MQVINSSDFSETPGTTADNQLTPAAPASQLVGRFAVSLWRRASPKRSRRLPPSTAVYLREPLEQTLCLCVSVTRTSSVVPGPLTVPGGIEGLGFVKTKHTNQTLDWPDIEFHYVSGTPASDGGRQLRKIQGLTEEVGRPVASPSAIPPSRTIDRWPQFVGQIEWF